jgi:acetyl esterase/lipase
MTFKLMGVIVPLAVALVVGLTPSAPAQPGKGKGPTVPDGVKRTANVEYAKVGEKKLLLDLYIPEKAEGPLPVVVGIFGGAWLGGSKEQAQGVRLSGRGYAVVTPNYRLSGEAVFPAQIEDCKAAVRWVRANAKKYNLDPDRIGAIGHSAGGHLASLLGTSAGVKDFEKGDNQDLSSKVQAVCAMSGPTDFLQMDAHAPKGAFVKHDPANSPESKLIGGEIQKNKEKVAKANPITYVSKDSPPFLLIHGEADNVVPAHQSELLNDALKKAGVDVTIHLVKGAGHGVGGKEVNDMIDAFFDKHLKGGGKPNK